MKSYSSREVIKIVMEAGWYLYKVSGSHHHFLHRERPGKVTIPHPYKDLKLPTLKSIFRQAGLDWRKFR